MLRDYNNNSRTKKMKIGIGKHLTGKTTLIIEIVVLIQITPTKYIEVLCNSKKILTSWLVTKSEAVINIDYNWWSLNCIKQIPSYKKTSTTLPSKVIFC